MTSTVLINVKEYQSSVSSAIDNLLDLKRRCDANHHLEEHMGPLVLRLNNCLWEFTQREINETLPTLADVRNHLAEWDTSATFTEIQSIQVLLETDIVQLSRIVQKHTSTLSNLKQIQNSSNAVQTSLHTKALRMKENGKDHKAGAAAAVFVGGLLAPFTFGASLLAGGVMAKGLYDEGEDLMVAYRELRGESAEAFSSFTGSVSASINVIQKVVVLVRGILEEIRSLAASESKLQLLRAGHKADYLRKLLENFLDEFPNL